MLVGISLTACGRASGGGPKRETERDGAVPCVKIADGMDATTTRNRHVASTLLCNVRICFFVNLRVQLRVRCLCLHHGTL
jgi:hypothetical protein